MGSKKKHSSSEELPSRKREKKHRKRRYSSSEEEEDDDDGDQLEDDDVSSPSSSSEEDRSHKRGSRDHSRRAHHKEKRRKKADKREKRKEHRRRHGSSSRKKSKEKKYSDSENELPGPSEVLSTILRKFPEVARDLEKLLEMIDDGQAVDISGLTNKHVAAYLRELFRSLRLHQTPNGLFLLPENAAKKTMDILQPTLTAHFCALSNNMTTSSEPREQVTDKDSMDFKQDDRLVERSDEKKEINVSEETCGPSEQKRRVIGPAMPSVETLAAAAKLTEASIALRAAEEELELDPLIGPPPPAAVVEAESANEAERFEEVERILAPDIENAYEILGLRVGATPEMLKKRYWKLSLLVHPDKCSHPHAHQAFTMLNQAFKDLQDPSKRSIIDNQIEEKETRREFEAELKSKREAAQWRKLRGEALPGDDALLDPPKAPTRDEWMTQLPPERRAGPPSMHSTFFSKSEKSGRGDTSIWTDTPLEKAQKAKTQYLEAYKQAALQGGNVESPVERDSNSQARELMDRFNSAKRSTSLLEKRQLQHSKKPKKDLRKEEPPEWVGNHPWKPWDREKDLTAGRQSVKLDKDNMAQGLSNRFSSSHTQRSFL